jgi:hypothetical protein
MSWSTKQHYAANLCNIACIALHLLLPAGTLAAQKNGLGVLGVIPGPAEVYIVRVFNDSGDVNQGQGLVYGSTLILAFTQCEGRLAAMQVRGATTIEARHVAEYHLLSVAPSLQ